MVLAYRGRTDRSHRHGFRGIAVTEVMIVDYKTNRPPPLDLEQVAPAYLVQLRAYRAALERIYPGKRVRTLLLWTDGPRLMEVDACQPTIS